MSLMSTEIMKALFYLYGSSRTTGLRNLQSLHCVGVPSTEICLPCLTVPVSDAVGYSTVVSAFSMQPHQWLSCHLDLDKNLKILKFIFRRFHEAS